MIDYLVFALCILSLVQKDKHRRFAAMLFAFPAAAHGLILGPLAISGEMSGQYYFLTAGFVDVSIMTLLSMVGKPSRFTTMIISISFYSLIFNSYACIAWWSGWPESVNVSLFSALYGVSIIVFLWMDTVDELTSNSNLCIVRMFNSPSHNFISRV